MLRHGYQTTTVYVHILFKANTIYVVSRTQNEICGYVRYLHVRTKSCQFVFALFDGASFDNRGTSVSPVSPI